ncbi:pyrrolo-quinoline quinone [Methylobacillus caricis]|uniref:pilus assembly protein n=1 Tax=Methylobacillus caricis TaxID=1971611 RepID=UPI001CFFF0D9|nr:PilC/PilY family type IV pilus protein [Methylobacillus caricis]MCB5188821.1 pyrrolo-quinoline quinone [Methylobacillus caricis]
MKRKITIRLSMLLTCWMLANSWLAHAAVTDISSNPLSTASGTVIRPNVMFVLDDSGSMNFNFMPDHVGYTQTGNKCRSGSTGRTTISCAGTSQTGYQKPTAGGDPPVYSPHFNAIYYNPAISYSPPTNPCDVSQSLPTMNGTNTNGWAAVRVQGHTLNNSCVQNSSIANILSEYPELAYCRNTSDCMRNGINQRTTTTNSAFDNRDGDYDWPYGNYTTRRTINSNPHYFLITPREYCTDSTLSICVLATSASTTHPVPAYVRYCASADDVDRVDVVSGTSGGSNKCQAKLDANHLRARYGNFVRVDITSGNTYTKYPDRIDCLGNTCSYAEEMTNFANWYAYYRTRLFTMKTAAGLAFSTIDNTYRVGFLTINPGSPVSTNKYLKIDEFEPAHKTNWYKKFYSTDASGGTPLRQALSRVGRHYAGVINGINSGMSDDPVQFACQQNFTILTTDGYWNGAAGVTIGNGSIGNQDNVDGGYSKRSDGAYDGAISGASDTLADVAMYYYKTDLRDMENKVPTTSKDKNTAQHMNTFTLGLGLDGELDYRSDYEIVNEGHFAEIKQGLRNWPKPDADSPTALDDLWHAAVNGRGLYFSAKQPNELISGLRRALAGVSDRTGSSSAATTSTPNITQTDNKVFSATYRSLYWDGELLSQVINPVDGTISETAEWGAQAKLNALAGASSDSRRIYKIKSNAPLLENFSWESMTSEQKVYFSNKCDVLSQCNGFNESTKVIANSGQNMVNYLRGQSGNSGESVQTDKAYRLRNNVLGDLVSSTPAYVKQPNYNYADNVARNYQSFKNEQAGRHGMVYVGGNDGMLHAFNAETGTESWAYVPHSIMPNMYKLADKNYGESHQYFVDGSPQVRDFYDTTSNTWRTILVGGFNSGGRGYYALDVTNEDNPKALWEFCHSSAHCQLWDEDLGYTYGNPVIAKMPAGSAYAGRWVVMLTSGYNNISPGNGQGYLYIVDALTGALLQKVGTGVGTSTTPSGFTKLASSVGINGNADVDATVVALYGGDLEGNLWKLDLQTNAVTISRMATLLDTAGIGQPITTRPIVGKVPSVTDPVVFVGTGRYLGLSDVGNNQRQSIYAIRDNGTSYNGRSLTQRVITQGDNTSSISGDNLDWANGGWYVDLPGNRERVNIDPQLSRGTLVVASNSPEINNEGSAADGCSLGGTARLYQFDYRTGLMIPGSTTFGVTLPIGSVVGLTIMSLPNGKLIGTMSGPDGEKPQVPIDTVASDQASRRTGWRELTK